MEFLTNGVSVIIISWIIIICVGALKDFGLFSKISKGTAKPIFLLIDGALAFGFSAIYFAIFKIDFSGYLLQSITTLIATLSLYATYENTKLKELVKIAKEQFIKVVGKGVIAKEVEKLSGSKELGEKVEEVLETVDKQLSA